MTGLSIFFSWDCRRISTSHLQSQSDAKNLFSVVFESAVRKWKIAFQRLSVSVHKAPNFLVFESFPIGSRSYRKGLLSYPTQLILQTPLAFDSDLLRVMPLIFCLQIFLAIQSEACLQCSILETIPYMIYQLEQCHHKLRQAFDRFQPHFFLFN